MTPAVREINDWFVNLLEYGTRKPVGDHEMPALPDPKSPYCIVYSIPGGGFSGSLASPESDVEVVFQVTSGGKTRGQAQWMADLVRRTVIGRTSTGFSVQRPAPDGWSIPDRRPLGGPGGVDPEGNLPHRVYSVADRYTICVTPA